jgi:WD40 repeat protein
VDGKDAGYLADNLQYTTDGKHLIGIGRTTTDTHVLVDGKSLFKAKGIFGVFVSPVTNRIAAVLLHLDPSGSQSQFLLIDGKPVEASNSDQIKKVVFSPDGKRYAAICGRSGAEYVIVDGKKGQEYNSINPLGDAVPGTALTFSPDSSKVGYMASSAGKFFIVINDEESDAFEGNAAFLFSPDGKHVVMTGMQNRAWMLSIDGKVLHFPGNTTASLESFSFSPDMTRYAYFTGGALRDGGPVFVDGKETGVAGLYSLSPDSKHVAIVGYGTKENKKGLFLDGQLAFPAELQILYHAFTPDTQHLYWIVREPAKGPDAAPGSYEFVTYLDGKPVARCEQRPETDRILMPNGFGTFTRTPPSWSVGPDGTLTCFAVSGNDIKRVKVTPGSDTSLATISTQTQAAGTGKSGR